MFDWIPTIPEVFNFMWCRVGDHVWVDYPADRVRSCSNCGKRENY